MQPFKVMQSLLDLSYRTLSSQTHWWILVCLKLNFSPRILNCVADARTKHYKSLVDVGTKRKPCCCCQNKIKVMLLKQNISHVVDAWTTRKSCWWCQNKSYFIMVSLKVVWPIFLPNWGHFMKNLFSSHPSPDSLTDVTLACEDPCNLSKSRTALPYFTESCQTKPVTEVWSKFLK